MSQAGDPKEEKKEAKKGRKKVSIRSGLTRKQKAIVAKHLPVHVEPFLNFRQRLENQPDFVNPHFFRHVHHLLTKS